ncbi:pseudouridine synthase [Waddlia chondrophila]|uniref:Pseudouridine synthase n=1 Tax=Waddlia chondrophila (strain ATCC VR-1470 / WSU 86-1044) TaxID=716544 RepID=D6YU60_WADCW|nr:pseudouridine synthase [Waddlia chondrophila]ADI37671.1 RNA pseudouridylate synthase family protein [Waddlia chondrophila WSU 86-1044]
MNKKRIAKHLASCGIASRRKCEDLIFAGKVSVNGEVVRQPQLLVDGSEKITVSGKKVNRQEKKVYFMLNKPLNTLCSPNGKKGSKLVTDLFEGVKERLFTVGRLDKETTGLLIVTNDGEFTNQVIHPSSNIQKEYIAKTDCEISNDHLKAIAAGTSVEGVFVQPLSVKKVRKATLKVVVGEGKKREVRLLIAAAGLEVRALKRTRIGSLTLGSLPIGHWRSLTERDKQLIFE